MTGVLASLWMLDLRHTCRNDFRMKALSLLVSMAFTAALLLVAGCKTQSSDKSNTVELFDGKDFDGWTFCMMNNADPMQTWNVHDGVIHCTGLPHGYIRTEKIYDNYELTVLWRFLKVAPHRDNTGVLVQIHLPDKVFPQCVECQGQYLHQGDILLCHGASADGHPVTGKTILIPQNGPPNEKPVGEWDTDHIICRNGSIKLFVNGKLMNQITGCNLTSGYIGIQSEGGDIEISKVSLQPLE